MLRRSAATRRPVAVSLLLLLAGAAAALAAPAATAPEWDPGYTAKIREYTTGPEFLTDLVDHLPASDTVPTPERLLGYIAGAPDRLTYAADVHRYLRALAAASPRVEVFSLGESEEGRELILVAIADEATIGRLDEYREITRRLADPRRLDAEEAERLIATGKPIYHMTGALHSPETGSPEMFMELAYRLAVDESPFIRAIRENVITLITPVLEVDGRERMVDIVRLQQANPDAPLTPLVYWGKYVVHDNNRDTMSLALALTRHEQQAYFDWHPQVLHDFHESVPFLYISTGTGPFNPALDPLALDELHRLAYNETQTLTGKGLVGVWTHGFYDGWAPNYLFWVAFGHNSIGRFYETYGNLVPATMDRVVRGASQREWFRPNPPYPQVRWSLRNNVNYQQSGALVALKYAADHREQMLRTFWDLGRRAIAKATTEGPAAYVLRADQPRRGQLRDLLTLLGEMGVEVHETEAAVTLAPGWPPAAPAPAGERPAAGKEAPGKLTFPAGSFVIRMDQPYSRLADTFLDTQYVAPEDRVYDDTGWTFGYTKNVDVARIVNPEILKVPMRAWAGKLGGTAPAGTAAAFAIANHADTDLVRLRYLVPGARFAVLEEELKAGGATLPPGTVLVEASEEVRRALAELGSFESRALASWPTARQHDLPLPRIALLHTWLNTQDEGWFRLAFESLGVPYDYLSTQQVAAIGDLRDRWDVIVFPPAGGTPQEIVNGLPAGPPLPWKKTALTPNLGVDETDDMRPGLGLAGVANLQRFVEEGGLLIAVRSAAEFAVQYGLARHVTIEPGNEWRPGTILRAEVTDPASPVAWGYGESVPVHFAGSPLFRVGRAPFSGDDRRPSGRGSLSDPDVPQGRRFVATPPRPEAARGEKGFQLPEEMAFWIAPRIPQPEDRPRVVLAFPEKPDQLLLSGMLKGAAQLAGAPVVIDCPRGRGHILLFANNPMWRQGTQGNFALVFNAILNAGHLGLGWPPEKTTTAP